ncbi:hypothetical protein HNR19_001407 [Nocardioides thalensis]|uniref:Uncharacterized protein n=1 Tax=Nocardioides thalensis TaxID=1914755 RepID=A0A853BZY8_9ACTN|nr:hypothetical protein [Nocardioides thalensis]NYJ00709.1 hypothetical protein [Nocardioides thalensis]
MIHKKMVAKGLVSVFDDDPWYRGLMEFTTCLGGLPCFWSKIMGIWWA